MVIEQTGQWKIKTWVNNKFGECANVHVHVQVVVKIIL